MSEFTGKHSFEKQKEKAGFPQLSGLTGSSQGSGVRGQRPKTADTPGRPGGREAGRPGPPHFQMEPAVYSDPVLHELHRHLEFLNSGLCGDFLVLLYPSSQPVTTPWLSPEAWHWENPGLGNQSGTSPAQVVPRREQKEEESDLTSPGAQE